MTTNEPDLEVTDLRQALARAQLMNRVLRATATSLNAQTVLQQICDELADIFQAPQVGIALINPDCTALTVAADHTANSTSTVGEQIPIEGNPITQYVLEHRVPMYIADVRTDPRLSIIHDLMARQAIVTLIIIPIMAADKVLGTLGIGTYLSHAYSDDEVELMAAVAEAASAALANARLHTTMKTELERRQEAEAIIAAQEQHLRELSTPLLVLADGVLIMPLVGYIDTKRAEQVMGALLHGVSHERARTVILDITGIGIVDTHVARLFIQAAQAITLLGARVVLTGIGPEVAQTLISLGVSLVGIQTYSTLQQAIQSVLRQKGGA